MNIYEEKYRQFLAMRHSNVTAEPKHNFSKINRFLYDGKSRTRISITNIRNSIFFTFARIYTVRQRSHSCNCDVKQFRMFILVTSYDVGTVASGWMKSSGRWSRVHRSFMGRLRLISAIYGNIGRHFNATL